MKIIQPMLAKTTGQEPIDSPEYIWEWKWNGLRIIGHCEGESALLQGRSGADFTLQFPELADLARQIKADQAVVDGEVVCLDERGLPDFNRIQHRIGKRDPLAIKVMAEKFPATYMIFDVLEVFGTDITARSREPATLMQRKAILGQLVVPDGAVKLSPWVDTAGTALLKEAERLGQEGVMAKTKSGLYHLGGRLPDWQKFKVPKWANFVIGGYTQGTGWREDMMGAIILGKPAGGGLRWVGNAGSGFTIQVLTDLLGALQTIHIEECPFLPGTKVPKVAAWVQPILVAEVKYFDVTRDGQLIWPIFQRVRTELTPDEVNDG